MSKQMTPCENLGYKVGDKFTVIKDSYFEKGAIVVLSKDDGSAIPWFTCGSEKRCLIIGDNADVKPVAKLKPAKQALADAIHQNGGWAAARYQYAASNYAGMVKVFVNKPKLTNSNWNADGTHIRFAQLPRTLQNWHQCILSRDEYFTAYPEQVKVEVSNETEHKVDVEIKSESEMTVKVGDWHKNGELPPVGEVCEAYADDVKPEVCKIVAYHNGHAAVIWDEFNGGCLDVIKINKNGWKFRPIRTERYKAIDEMLKDSGALRCETVESIIENLLDAGWKKGDK